MVGTADDLRLDPLLKVPPRANLRTLRTTKPHMKLTIKAKRWSSRIFLIRGEVVAAW